MKTRIIIYGSLLIIAILYAGFSVVTNEDLFEKVNHLSMGLLYKYMPTAAKKIDYKLNPYLEIVDRVRMEPSSVQFIRKSWMPYFHRHERVEDVLEVIALLNKEDQMSEPDLRFFSTVFKYYPEAEESARNQLTNYVDKKRTEFELLLDKVENFPVETTPVKLDSIWYDYAVTGDSEKVKAYIDKLGVPETSDEQKQRISDNLLHLGSMYYPIYGLLSAVKHGSETRKNSVDRILVALNDRYFDSSRHYYYLAKNHMNSKEYDQALKAALNGLSNMPDNPYLLQYVGSCLFEKSKNHEAIELYNYAKKIMPENGMGTLIYKMVEVYYRLGNMQKVIELYHESAELYPDDVSVITNLGWAYDEIGDTKMAEKYYRQCFNYEMSPEVSKYAVGFFKRHSLDIPKRKKSINNLLVEENYQELEKVFHQALEKREIDENGSFVIYSMYSKATPDNRDMPYMFEQHLPLLTNWVDKYPDSYPAHTCLGKFYENYAWNARGVGYARTITDTNRKLFHERLRLSAKYYQRAYEINPGFIGASASMVAVARLHPDWADSRMEEWFEKAVTTEPRDSLPYITKANYLKRKWGGSDQEEFQFARWVYSNAPLNSMAPVVLAKAHYGKYLDESDSSYFRRPAVWKEVKELHQNLLKRFPKAMVRHNWFARYACMAEDYQTARNEFEIIGDDLHMYCWNSQEELEYCKSKAFTGKKTLSATFK